MIQLPKTAIIIPTYNSEKVQETNIVFAVNQFYINKDIIIDGNSTDSTLGIINKYKK